MKLREKVFQLLKTQIVPGFFLLYSRNALWILAQSLALFESSLHSSSCTRTKNITEIVSRWIIEGSNGQLIIRDFDHLSRGLFNFLEGRATLSPSIIYVWKINNPSLAGRICSAKRYGRAWRCYPNVTQKGKAITAGLGIRRMLLHRNLASPSKRARPAGKKDAG